MTIAERSDYSPQRTNEEQRRFDCANADKAAASSTGTQIAADIASLASIVGDGADAVAAISVFVPGGQGIAGGAKIGSLIAQGIQGAANLYIGQSTGNYSALKSQGAQFATGFVGGKAISGISALGIRGATSLSKGAASRFGAFGDAAGAVAGDSAGGLVCGR